jgi:hypothetical protein
MVEIFIKSVKDMDDVFELCDNHRKAFHKSLKMNEYLARRYMLMAIDEGDTISVLKKETPKKYYHILKNVIEERLMSKRIKVNWTPITRELDLSPPPKELMDYLHQYSPVGFRGLYFPC